MDVSIKSYDPLQERILGVITQKTGNQDKDYFRVIIAYIMCTVASQMRTNITTHDAQSIPVNCYAMSLAGSGYSKTFSLGILENTIVNRFTHRFMEETMYLRGEQRIHDLAHQRSSQTGSDFEEEKEKMQKEFSDAGEYMSTFSEGTSPALKQMRHKLILNDCGSLNFIVDEMGMNLIDNGELLKSYLELYDVGLIKNKLIKNSKDNKRVKQMLGRTPANVLMFGTPDAVFDGSKVEDAVYSYMHAGFARRTLFATGTKKVDTEVSAEELYQQMTNRVVLDDVNKLAIQFEQLADINRLNTCLHMSKEVAIRILEYKLFNAKRAQELPPHEEIFIAETQHRHFKAMKIAGAYTFCDSRKEISMDDFMNAVSLVEDSGANFQKMMVRERNYEKLAKYLAHMSKEVTHADLMEDLPFYKGAQGKLNEMMQLAAAWGHSRHIVIKRKYIDGIEFFKGEALKETNLDEMITCFAQHLTGQYFNKIMKWENISKLTQHATYSWLNHHVRDSHRSGENLIKGFNMAVLDIDGEFPLDAMKAALDGYTYHIYTTKSNGIKGERYRVIMPLSHTIELSRNDYRAFMNNLHEWLPFELKDIGSNQPERAWASHVGQSFDNVGELLDARMFIPQTKASEHTKEITKELKDLSKLERWFAMHASEGNRNNTMVKYAFMLVDSGMPFDEIQKSVLNLNEKLNDPLSENELANTVFKSVHNKLYGTPP